MSAFDRLKKLCDKQGISVNKLEERIGLSKNTLYSWKKNTPKGSNLTKVADYFNVSTDYLLDRIDNPTNEESLETWFRKGNPDLTKDEQDTLLEDVEDYLEYRKQRILKERRK